MYALFGEHEYLCTLLVQTGSGVAPEKLTPQTAYGDYMSISRSLNFQQLQEASAVGDSLN